MTSDYLDAFIREGNEQITELNNALLRLEDDPGDTATMDDIFRSAHTLKGNFAAMGFEDASDLAHAVEDMLDAMREDDMSVTADRMDLVFEGVDQLDAILDEIDADGENPIDPNSLVEEFRAAIDAHCVEEEETKDDGECGGSNPDDRDDDLHQDGESNSDVGDGLGPSDTRQTLAAADDVSDLVDYDADLYHVRATVQQRGMAAPDGMMTVQGVSRFDLVAADPPVAAIESGAYDRTVDLFVGGGDPESITAALSGQQSVEGSEIRSATDEVAGLDPDDVDGGESAGSTGDVSESSETKEADPVGAESTASADALPSREESWNVATPDDDPFTWDDDAGAAGNAGAGAVEANDERGATDDGAANDDTGGSDDAEESGDTGGSDEDPSEGSRSSADDRRSVDGINSIHVDVDQLDDLYGQVEQLVTNRIKLGKTLEDADVDVESDLEDLDKTTASLQDTVMDLRLVPMQKVVGGFPRVVRDLAREQGKEIDFEMEGTDVELDRTILDSLSDPLMHVIRNAVDHGIEPPEEREDRGKPPEGSLTLRAHRERDRAIIQVEDDGRGLDAEELRQEALEEDVRTEEELDSMADDEVYDLVFHPGFSTTEEVTDVSGRGVGMDVVHTTVTRLDGAVDVESTPDEGTTVTLDLPVSIAIVRVLFVAAGDQQFGIPIKKIDQVTRFDGVQTVNGQKMIEYDDDLYRVVCLHDALDTVDSGDLRDDTGDDGLAVAADGAGEDRGMLLRIRRDERPIALYCDAVTEQEEVVVKPLEGQLAGTKGLSGTAVLGEGNVVPVLDLKTV